MLLGSFKTPLICGHLCVLVLWDPGSWLLVGGGEGGRSGRVGRASSLHLHSRPCLRRSRFRAPGGRSPPSPGISVDASAAPLPWGPQTFVLLGRSASDSPAPFWPSGAVTAAAAGTRKEGAVGASPLSPDLPTFPSPVPPPAKLRVAAAQLCPPAPRRTQGRAEPEGSQRGWRGRLGRRGTVPGWAWFQIDQG